MVKIRVITALVLAAVLLSAVFGLSDGGWAVFVGLVVLLAGVEWGRLNGAPGLMAPVFALFPAVLIVASYGLMGEAWRETVEVVVYGLSAFFWLLSVPVILRFKPKLCGAVWMFAAGLCVLTAAGLALISLREVHPWLLIAAMTPVWVADISAFFVGRKFGQRKLAPFISPGKSWEGVAGATVGVVTYGLLLRWVIPELGQGLGVAETVLLSLFLTAMSVIGDLLESLMKRQAGVKDSGTLLPGHGGVLDRVDSLLSTLPFVGVLVVYWHYLT